MRAGRTNANQEHSTHSFTFLCASLPPVHCHSACPVPLLKIHEEESTRTSSSHRTFVAYLSPIPLLHHTLCSNDTKIQYKNLGCTGGHCGHITRRTSCHINLLSPFHCTRTHVSVKSVPTVLTLVRNPGLDHHLDHSHPGCRTSRNYFLTSAHGFPQLTASLPVPFQTN